VLISNGDVANVLAGVVSSTEKKRKTTPLLCILTATKRYEVMVG
jgi:hypothetical protein